MGCLNLSSMMGLSVLLSLEIMIQPIIYVRPMMKFENGYTVETVFDGSKLGIEPYSVELLPSGELLVMDSANSNTYRISASLSQFLQNPKKPINLVTRLSNHFCQECMMNSGYLEDDADSVFDIGLSSITYFVREDVKQSIPYMPRKNQVTCRRFLLEKPLLSIVLRELLWLLG